MPSLTRTKAWLRGAVRAAGFELVRRRAGLDASLDVARILGAGARVVFDVGANIGQTVTNFAKHFPDAHVLAFEPNTEVFAALRSNVGCLPHVSCLPIALSDEDGSGSLFVTDDTSGSSLLPLAAGVGELNLGPWTTLRGEQTIPVRRLDSFCREREISSIDLLKSDTQGAELKVLGGAGEMLHPATIRALLCEVLFISVYERQAFFEDVYLLTSRGYRLVGFYNEARDERDRLMWCDALFI